jgi:hypothetical protein
MWEAEYRAILIFAIFIASGVSFLSGMFPRIFVRIIIAVVGIVGFLLISGGLIFGIGLAAGFGARSLGQDGLVVLGAVLVAVYFVVCTLTSLPILPNQYLRPIGLGLHFIYMPIAVFLTTLTETSLPFEYSLSRYATSLTLGLIYAMLWFRMVEAQKTSS